MGRRRQRTFTGCWKCRKRKVKCDETRPGCLACARTGEQCGGYGSRLVWMGTDESTWRSEGRRALSYETTWGDVPVIPSSIVDALITGCDETPKGLCGDTIWSLSCIEACTAAFYNPFNVFPAHRQKEEDKEVTETSSETGNSTPGTLAGPLSMQTLVPQALPVSKYMEVEALLFHHYITYVAVIMMPYAHPRNPWVTEWPAAALEEATTLDQRALYNVTLAQSAFNLANLGDEDNKRTQVAIGSKYYHRAIHELRRRLDNDDGAATSTMLVATILTLVFTEAYIGQSRTWRHHLRAACTFLSNQYVPKLWTASSFGQRCLESLMIIRVISDTSENKSLLPSDKEDLIRTTIRKNIAKPLTRTADFGFTVGAPPVILECMARISEFRLGSQSSAATPDSVLEKAILKLDACRAALDLDSENSQSTQRQDCFLARLPEETAQASAFLYATYIHLYRSLLNVPPAAVQNLTSKALEATLEFFKHSSSNFSIWPAFVAAAEAYTARDREMAANWLSRTASFGLGNRVAVKKTLEQVWKRRELLSLRSGMDIGMIPVDWRDVMHELDCDVLLV